ncbi:MAG: hypothetical protein ABH879_07265 [archaeon]
MDKKARIAMISALVLVGVLAVAAAMAAPRGSKACSDGNDNDGDGYIDLNDPGCASKNDLSELNPNVECDDGADNDGDSAADYNDNGCSGPTDNDETDCGDAVCEGGEACDVCVADCGICDSCSDTDGGWIPGVAGTVSGYADQEWYSIDDYCLDNVTVNEYYCIGGGDTAAAYPYHCNLNESSGCVDGACA